ncbi:MAG: DUF2589 domain-containing protein [Spirochaetaceae bacterium]|jgi:hypothetical protein|nr:DUF2589 domain-containing protein [Spirochaetaceae bacterium]
MAIGAQFAGLDMGKLIGGPLTAAADASITLARSTAEFINTVGFNPDQSVRTVLFKFEKSDQDPLGNPVRNEMRMEVPMLAIVPIPNLQIDEVNILFDMEVRECEKSESSLDAGAKFSLSAGFGPVKINITGSVSVHQSNTRSSDNSAKYHVDVRATNHGYPEGLARVMDIMAASAAPVLLESKMVDGNGKEVDAASKAKRTALSESYANQQRMGAACKAAFEKYEASLNGLRDSMKSVANAQRQPIQQKMNAVQGEHEDADREKYSGLLESLDDVFSRASADSKLNVEGAADAAANGGAIPGFTNLFDMKNAKFDTASEKLVALAEADAGTAQNYLKQSIEDFKVFKEQEKALAEERAKYNDLLMKR